MRAAKLNPSVIRLPTRLRALISLYGRTLRHR